jgi:hypothetical protein
MSKNNELYMLPPGERPSWLVYPRSFCRIVEQSLIHITPWHVMEAQRAAVHSRGLAERYPTRELFPFAYRQGDDDVACWAKGMGEKVFIIHDFASPGWEARETFDDVWSWFVAAVAETVDWD